MVFLLVLASLSDTEAIARTYTTNFPSVENPISEGGNWINGGTVGLDWNNVQVNPSNRAHGLPTEAVPKYADPNAILTGTWGADQTVQGTVYSNNPTASYYQEVELHLRRTLSAHVATGYEVIFRCLKTSSGY